MVLKQFVLRVGAVLVAGTCLSAVAAVSEQDAAKLGTVLTPVGAEKAGNADGSIPAWTGAPLQTPAGWTLGQPRPDPYASEKPVLVIDATNVDKFKDKLSASQIALITGLKGYRMDVYPTHRDCSYPDYVYERTRKNATSATMAANGYDIDEATPAGVPFPLPQSGAEAIWNHKLHWTGEGRIERYSTIFSQPSGRDFVPLVQNQVAGS